MEGQISKVNHHFPPVLFQIAQIDMLTKLGLKPDGIVGHSVGELACGYADGSLSLKEAVLAAYWRGRCIKEASLPPGGMAAVGENALQNCVCFICCRTAAQLHFK